MLLILLPRCGLLVQLFLVWLCVLRWCSWSYCLAVACWCSFFYLAGGSWCSFFWFDAIFLFAWLLATAAYFIFIDCRQCDAFTWYWLFEPHVNYLLNDSLTLLASWSFQLWRELVSCWLADLFKEVTLLLTTFGLLLKTIATMAKVLWVFLD
jgi:hypothetical protein